MDGNCSKVQGSRFKVRELRGVVSTIHNENKSFRMSIHAGRARAAISGFIKYLPAYEQGRRNNNNPEP